MTRVDFYFNAHDRIEVARRLAAKVLQSGQRALLYVSDPALAAELDSGLWTQDKLSFLPHVRCGHPLAAETPLLIGTDPAALASHDVLINLDNACPTCFSRFERLLEVVSTDPADRDPARERYRFYRDRGYAIENHDLARR
ncbi:DNA polymerase III subunit chi [Parasulfuritortus cantonensis]|uniref:DNA polymerase III subunit chi n=1 Tax=Parasulfuritortus cantonensis TaxID=2528202 RepID=A0A4R1BPW1_9PROT|nr:DNA polymerase III subunit chi [Parasulfuritortus cantonensis]TCJ19538.1 DNA polymerase III subunit chi [Parasulfuritortus cantonensis]